MVFSMDQKYSIEERLKKIILNDKIKSYDGFLHLLNSDLEGVLSQYMEISDIKTEVVVNEKSNYILNIRVEANNIMSPNSTY